jgi:hypothetical protein
VRVVESPPSSYIQRRKRVGDSVEGADMKNQGTESSVEDEIGDEAKRDWFGRTVCGRRSSE